MQTEIKSYSEALASSSAQSPSYKMTPKTLKKTYHDVVEENYHAETLWFSVY